MGVVIRQSIKATLITYIGAFIGFLTTMFVLTKYLQPEEIGLTKVLLEVGLLFSVFAQLGTSSSAMRFFPYFKNKGPNHNGFFFYLLLLPFVGCLIFIPLYLLLREPIGHYFERNSSLFVSYYYYAAPLILFLVYWTVMETWCTLNLRIVMPKLIREVIVRLLLVVVYLLYGFRLIQLNGLVYGFICVYGLAMLLTFWYASAISSLSLAHRRKDVDRSLVKEIARYSFYLIMGAFGGTIISKLDIFMVSAKMGLDFAGIYSIAFYMAAIIEIPSRSITSISSPIVSKALKEEDLESANLLYKKVSLHQLIAGSLIFVLVWVNIDNIFAVIPNGAVYSQGKWVVFFIGISKLIEVTLGFGGIMISYTRYFRWFFFFTLFMAAVTVVTNNMFIPIWGVMGAAMATALTCLITYSMQQWLVLKKIKGNPYSIGTFKQITLVLLLFLLNYFLPRLESPWWDGIYRSVLTGGVGMVLLYLMKVSPDVNRILSVYFNRIKG